MFLSKRFMIFWLYGSFFEPRNIDEELNDCFDIYVSISKIYKPHPDRLRDWVSHPKANGYQACTSL